MTTTTNHNNDSSIRRQQQTPGDQGDRDDDDDGTIRVLALHGAEGNAQEFQRGLTEWNEVAFFAHGVSLDIQAVQAPHVRGDGFAWWTLPPGVRSRTATEYQGFEESITRIQQALLLPPPPQEGNDDDDDGNDGDLLPPDLVVAHSQGAIFTTALLALDRWPHQPRLGFILNGSAWPNPYTQQLQDLQLSSSCRILMVTGETDRINPPDTQAQVQQALADAGASVTTIEHSGGHGVPTRNIDAVEQIVEWIVQGVASSKSS